MKIFISYKHENEARNRWVEELVRDLGQKHGLECLADFMHRANTVPDFSQRINECELVLIIVTDACKRALETGFNYVAYEASLAIHSSVNGKIQIIPVFREGEEMAYGLSVYPWVDFRDTSAYERSLLELLSLIRKKKRTATASPHEKSLMDSTAVVAALPEAASLPGLSASILAPHIEMEMLYAMWFGAVKEENIEQATRGILEYYKSNTIPRQYVNTVVIESFFKLAAEKQENTTYQPLFETVSLLRAQIFVRILQLKQAIPDEVCISLVDGLVEKLPSYGYAPYIQLMNAYLPCCDKYRMFWAGIIVFFFADNAPDGELSPTYHSLDKFRLNRLSPSTAAGAEKMLAALCNEHNIIRIHTLCSVICWAHYLRRAPTESCIYYNELQNALMKLVEDANPAIRVFALLTIRTLIQIPFGHADTGRIFPDHGYALASRFLQNPDKFMVDHLVVTLGVIFQRPYDSREIRNMLRVNPNDVFLPGTQKRILKAPSGVIEKFIQLITFADASFIANTQTRIFIAVALLRVGIWVAEMEPLLGSLLTGNKEPEALKREIVVRIIKANKDFSARLLVHILQSPVTSEELKILSLVGVLETSHAEFISSSAIKNLPIAADELRSILTEASRRRVGNLWRVPWATYLRDKLNGYELKRNQHRIHKIKAKDVTGKWACYFVYLEPEMEELFFEKLDGVQNMNLEDYGRVIASCYGEIPTAEVKLFLKERYGFEV